MTGKEWCADVAIQLFRRADAHEKVATAIVDLAVLATACADLPEDMAMRVRLLPDAFELKA